MKLTRSFQKELAEFNEKLGSDFAIISHILHNKYTVVDVASELETIKIGDEFETQNTYCREVVDGDEVVTYNQVGSIKAMVLHPIYTAMQLEAYIGEPLHSNGNIVGTLNFSGFSPKSPLFTDEEIAEVKALARSIEESMNTDEFV
jgi:hypothetical protein